MAQATPLLKNSHLDVSTNVVLLRQGVLPRHREYLARWLDAGARMGLFDAEIIDSDRVTNIDGHAAVDQVLVWVRENPDPAYMLRPHGMRWILVDQLRDHELGRYASFEHALHAIRPALPLEDIVAA